MSREDAIRLRAMRRTNPIHSLILGLKLKSEEIMSDDSMAWEGALSELERRDQEVLRMRHGFTSGNPLPLREIVTRFGVSRERIRQIRERGYARLLRAATRRGLVAPEALLRLDSFRSTLAGAERSRAQQITLE